MLNEQIVKERYQKMYKDKSREEVERIAEEIEESIKKLHCGIFFEEGTVAHTQKVWLMEYLDEREEVL